MVMLEVVVMVNTRGEEINIANEGSHWGQDMGLCVSAYGQGLLSAEKRNK